MATDATGTPTSPDNIARILPANAIAVTTLTSGVNAIADTLQTALNTYRKKAFVGAFIYRSSGAGAQSFAAADGTLTFTNTLYDTSTFWSGGTPSRATIPTTGYYKIIAWTPPLGGAFAGTRTYTVRKNGTTTVFGTPANTITISSESTFQAMPAVFTLSLIAGDYLEFFWSHGTSTGVSTSVGASGIITPGSNDTHGYINLQYIGT